MKWPWQREAKVKTATLYAEDLGEVVCRQCRSAKKWPRDYSIGVPNQIIAALGIQSEYVREIDIKFRWNDAASIRVEFLCRNDHVHELFTDLWNIQKDLQALRDRTEEDAA